MTHSTQPISNWMLEQYAVGELSASEMKSISERLKTDSDLSARLVAIKQSNQTILSDYPVRNEAAHIKQRVSTERSKSFSIRSLVPAGSLVGVLIVVVALITLQYSGAFNLPGDEDGSQELILTKGLTPHLNIYRKAGTDKEKLEKNQLVSPGDVLQVGYIAANKQYGLIFSIDGSGAVTQHFPSKGKKATKLEPKGEVLLSFAYELDNAPNFERFFFVVSNSPFEVAPILSRAKRLAIHPSEAKTESLQLKSGLTLFSILLKK